MRAFVECRIKPYYLHHGDLAPGTAHLRTTIEEGQALMQSLRGRVSGLCQPDYVLDIPGGYGKVPVGPGYISYAASTESDDVVSCSRLLRRRSRLSADQIIRNTDDVIVWPRGAPCAGGRARLKVCPNK